MAITLLDRLLGRHKAAERGSVPEWFARTADVQRWETGNERVWSKQQDLYRVLSWVQIAVQHVASRIATTPIRVKQRTGEELQDIDNHPFEMLLDNPNPRDTGFELLYTFAAYRALTGNAYWWLNRTSENAPPSEIWPIPSDRIRPMPDGRMGIGHYKYDPGDGQEIRLEAWEILHSRRFNPNNLFVGLSPVEAIATVAAGDKAMQKWNTGFFARDNAKPSGVLAFADTFQPAEWDALKQQLKQEYGGTKRGLMMLQNAKPGGVQSRRGAMDR